MRPHESQLWAGVRGNVSRFNFGDMVCDPPPQNLATSYLGEGTGTEWPPIDTPKRYLQTIFKKIYNLSFRKKKENTS